jgi:hypothetical protein
MYQKVNPFFCRLQITDTQFKGVQLNAYVFDFPHSKQQKMLEHVTL